MKKVSVVIPAHNAESTIEQTVESALIQGDFIEEIIAIVNGCSDNTEGILNNICRRTTKLKKVSSLPGKVPARNLGLKISKSEFIALLDADDLWEEKKIEKQLEFMEQESVDILGTQIEVVYPDLSKHPSQVIYPTSHINIVNNMLRGSNSLANSSVVIRSKILEYSGNYEDCFPFCEDYHLWLRCIKFAKFANLDEKLMTYRFEHKPEYDPRIAVGLASFYRSIYAHTGVIK